MTDLCTMRPHPETNEFEVTTLHPDVTEAQVREKTGWPVRFRGTVSETPPPTDGELATLRDLLDPHGARTWDSQRRLMEIR